MGDVDPAKTSVMLPPPGVVADIDGSGTGLQNVIVVVFAVSTALSTVAIVLRTYTRAVIVRSTGLDDQFAISAYFLCIAYFMIIVCTFQYGFAKHLWDVSILSMQGYLTMLIPTAAIYVWIPALVKFSLLVLFHRVNPDLWRRSTIYLIAAIVFGYSLATTIIVSTVCNPLRTSAAGCLAKMGLWQASLNIVTDFMIVVLPLPTLHKLQLPVKQKIGLGFVAVFASIARIIYMQKLVGNPDVTYMQAGAYICSGIEVNLSVVCCSLVVMKPFLQRYLPRLVSFSLERRITSRTRSGSRFKVYGKKHSSKAGRSYELPSIDAKEKYENGPIRVHVTKEFEMRRNEPKVMSDGDSTDQIITNDMKHC